MLALAFLREAIPTSMVVGILFIRRGVRWFPLVPTLPTIPAMVLGKVWGWKRGRA